MFLKVKKMPDFNVFSHGFCFQFMAFKITLRLKLHCISGIIGCEDTGHSKSMFSEFPLFHSLKFCLERCWWGGTNTSRIVCEGRKPNHRSFKIYKHAADGDQYTPPRMARISD